MLQNPTRIVGRYRSGDGPLEDRAGDDWADVGPLKERDCP